MDELDRTLVNGLQGGFPLCPRPYAAVAQKFNVQEEELVEKLKSLLADGTLTRFGPMFDAERLGGAHLGHHTLMAPPAAGVIEHLERHPLDPHAGQPGEPHHLGHAPVVAPCGRLAYVTPASI